MPSSQTVGTISHPLAFTSGRALFTASSRLPSPAPKSTTVSPPRQGTMSIIASAICAGVGMNGTRTNTCHTTVTTSITVKNASRPMTMSMPRMSPAYTKKTPCAERLFSRIQIRTSSRSAHPMNSGLRRTRPMRARRRGSSYRTPSCRRFRRDRTKPDRSPLPCCRWHQA